MNYKLSPSRINLMTECPRCFWLALHNVWKRPRGIFSSLPNGMDLVIKEHFDSHIESGTLPIELNGIKGCKLFNETEKLKDWRNNFKGISFSDEYGNILFGAVDNIIMNGKKLIVLDYKTKGYPFNENPEEYARKYYQNQLDIYTYLLRKNGYETEDYALLLFYIPTKAKGNGEFIFETHLVKLDVDMNNAEKLWKDALKNLNGECPSQRCEWCMLVD